MSLRLDFLTDTPLADISDAFRAAFADYYLPVGRLAEQRLGARLTKNAYAADCSVGAFDGDRLVAISLTGIDDWQGERSAFDAATGILPDYRGQGLARRMFEFALPRLRERGIVRFLLEVLTVNEPAIKAYRRVGFDVTRRFDCFELPAAALERQRTGRRDGGVRIEKIDRGRILELAEHLDWQPSWENSPAGVLRIPVTVQAYGAFAGDELVGTAVYYPLQNWILNLVVARHHRRRGVGSSLLRHLLARVPEVSDAVKLVNVPDTDSGMRDLLLGLGFESNVAQFEMELLL
ncbi:MAG: GNAT family N-acetyltransferase [bacterium]|nr:GNAT family N-acetyltransferase [bacterium]